MDNANPYSAPLEQQPIVEPAAERETRRIASTGKRFSHLIIDYIAFLVFSIAIGFVLGLVLAVLGAVDVLDEIPELPLGIAIMMLYYVPQEAIWGKTIGKLVTRTHVETKHGGTPTFGQILGRTLCRFIPFEAFSFLGGKGRPVGWHDSISGTCVVED